jgi:hypothetical protein
VDRTIFSNSSYVTVTVHYINNDWFLVDRVLATREFDPDLRHTGANIRLEVLAILSDFSILPDKAAFCY